MHFEVYYLPLNKAYTAFNQDLIVTNKWAFIFNSADSVGFRYVCVGQKGRK